MNVAKARWTSDGDRVRLSMPLTKVDVEKRLVHGFASLDNVDSHDDVVEAAASVKAFTRFRGNIREMHQPIAVGKMVDFREDEYFDKDSGEMHRGVFVSAYVSKGAQDTWEKVLDGTLSGFSIGGSIIDSDTEFNKDANKPIRYIKDYELVELSLVDNPANGLANIFTIEKNKNGEQFMKGMIAEVETATAYYCYEDGIAKVSTEESYSCPNCGEDMTDIGWFEYDADNKTEKLSGLVQKYLNSINNTQEEPAINEGGVDVADTVNKSAESEEVSEEVAVEETGEDLVVDEAGDPVEEEAADVSEVDDAEDDLAKMFEGFREEIKKVLEDNVSDVNGAIEEINGKFDDFSKSMDEKVSELAVKHRELSEKFVEVKEDIGKMEKSLSTLQDESAVRKSNDLGGSEEKPVIEKAAGSTWGGHFLGIDSLRN